MQIRKSKVIANISWLVAGRIVQMLFSFFVGILTARYLGPENYGLINYGSVYTGLFTCICSLGLNSIVVKELIENNRQQGEILGTIIGLKFTASIFALFSIFVLSSIIDSNDGLTTQVVVLCSLGLVFQAFTIFEFWFQSKLQSKVYAVATLIAYILVSIYRVILLILNCNVKWFAIATSLDYLCIALILYFLYKKVHGPKLSFSILKAKTMLLQSYHFILSSLMVAIYGNTDKFMLKHLLKDMNEVGYYALAASICMMWTFVLQAIIDSFYPSIMEMYQKNYKKYKKENILLYSIIFYISVLAAVGISLLAKPGIELLYGSAYLGAVAPLQIITWYTAFSYLGVARNAWMVCENKQKYLKYIYGLAVILNIVVNWLLIPYYGASGAAWASLITQIGTSIILPLFIKPVKENAFMMIDAITLKGMLWRKG